MCYRDGPLESQQGDGSENESEVEVISGDQVIHRKTVFEKEKNSNLRQRKISEYNAMVLKESREERIRRRRGETESPKRQKRVSFDERERESLESSVSPRKGLSPGPGGPGSFRKGPGSLRKGPGSPRKDLGSPRKDLGSPSRGKG